MVFAMDEPILNPAMVAEKGEKIYQEKYKDQLEKTSIGKFVAIEVESEKYFLADTAEDALANAKKEYPNKFFYLIKIGSAGIFKLGSFSPSKHTNIYACTL
jgi:hypothetical protein